MEVSIMWDDDLDSEEYERLTYDYDYPEYSSAKSHNKRASNEEYDTNSSEDNERFE